MELTSKSGSMIIAVTRTSQCIQNILTKFRGCCFYHGVSLNHDERRHYVIKLHKSLTHINIHPRALNYHREFLSVTKYTVNYNYCRVRFYSDFKDDDMVKSWLKEIKNDFENTNPKENELTAECFKDVENVVSDAEEKPAVSRSENLAPEEQLSLQKLEILANKYVHGIDVTEGSRTDSESDLLSSASESDSSDDESDKKHSKISGADTVEGFTKEEMINMLERNEISDDLGSDFDQSIKSDQETNDSAGKAESNTIDTTKDDSGIAVTNIGKHGLKDDWGVVEIEDFVNIKPEPVVESPWVPPISLERGKTGMFDVEDMVTLLKSANAFDIVVIQLPKAVQIGDYMVLASTKSVRQMTALAKDIQWIYKKRANKRNVHLRIEGEKTDWQAMDIGNLIVHLFLPEVRKVYDLESLWTVGPAYDENSREKEGTDPYVFSMDDLPWLKDLEKGQKDDSANKSKHEKVESVSNKYSNR